MADSVEHQAVEVVMEGLVEELGEMEGLVGMAEEAVGLEMRVEAVPQSAKYTTPLYAPIQTCHTKKQKYQNNNNNTTNVSYTCIQCLVGIKSCSPNSRWRGRWCVRRWTWRWRRRRRWTRWWLRWLRRRSWSNHRFKLWTTITVRSCFTRRIVSVGQIKALESKS